MSHPGAGFRSCRLMVKSARCRRLKIYRDVDRMLHSKWLLPSFSPLPVRHPVYGPGRQRAAHVMSSWCLCKPSDYLLFNFSESETTTHQQSPKMHRSTLSSLVFPFFLLAGVALVANAEEKLIGKFTNYHHGIAGDVYAVDEQTLK